ncbi:MAG: zinc ribbon domain-containing protein [Planctomycetota bacterium]|jgi:hypothetical protein
MNGAALKCPSCGEQIRPGDEFCASCGAEVPEEMKKELRRIALREGRQRVRTARASRDRKAKVAKAAMWILILAILFAGFGTLFGFIAKGQADDALLILSEHSDDQLYMVEGEVHTVAEWREIVKAEPRLIFITNYVLAAVMLGTFFWARKRAFPAIVTALCVFLAVQVLSAVVEPATLAQGWLIKILAIGAFIGGLKAALAERVAARDGVAAGPRRRASRTRRG